MKIKKIIIMFLLILIVTGCTNINNLSYEEIINTINERSNAYNTYRRGYKYNIPLGLSLNKAGNNYAVIESNDNIYYLYVDFISYNDKKEINYPDNANYHYYKIISNNGKNGYVIIKNYENNQYLIEIMYNYAKIEVMVHDSEVKRVLINTISILKSIVYDDKVIESLLRDDNLTYTEENFDMFSKSNSKSSILNYTDEQFNIEDNEDLIKDADLIN